MKTKTHILKMVLAAFFAALAYVMPFLTGQIPEIGSMLCPMHIPVLLCGFICGWHWGLAVGVIAPLMRSLMLGMPPILTAICMAFELAAYGALCGILYKLFPKRIPFIYCSLIISMILGRLVWGAAMFVCMGMAGNTFGLSAFVAGAFTNAIPGIVIQIILVPIIVIVLEKTPVFKKLC
ncbi:MAG: ECF transporter S component [Ruminococcaceae bacterium]|nr:ECF transporter S component [Oscillospiraceae bacterium]